MILELLVWPFLPNGVALNGGSKRTERKKKEERTDDENLGDTEEMLAEQVTPGHLQDRLVVLQAKAMEAIQALPAECREDLDYGMVETCVGVGGPQTCAADENGLAKQPAID